MIVQFPETTLRSYLTGMTAVNIPSPEGTGDWHFSMAFFGTPPERPPHYKIAGIDSPDTYYIFGNKGIYDCTERLNRYGVFGDNNLIQVLPPVGPIYAADHYRASADMITRRILDKGLIKLFTIDDWLSLKEEKEQFFEFIQPMKALGDDIWKQIKEWMLEEISLA